MAAAVMWEESTRNASPFWVEIAKAA